MVHYKRDLMDLESLDEETADSLKGSTWPRIRYRTKKQHITAKFEGVDKDGNIFFSTNSGNNPGKYRWDVTIHIKDFPRIYRMFKAKLLPSKKAIIKLMVKGDIQVHCSCPCWKYYFNYTAYKYGYAIHKETRPARIRNPRNDKSVCKHIYVCLLYILQNPYKIYREFRNVGAFK